MGPTVIYAEPKGTMRTASRLYSLEPFGIGTTRCESLTSYLARLAAAHCVSVTTLVSREIAPYISDWVREGARHIYRRASAINSCGKMADDFVAGLQTLTGRQDLSGLTMLTYRDLLTPAYLAP